MPDDRYWASSDTDDIGTKIDGKVTEFDQYLYDTGRYTLVRRAMDMYYGFDPDGRFAKSSAISFGGEQGETTLVRINHFRSLVDQKVILVTGQRPSFDAMAVNNDSSSAEEARLARGIFEYHWSKRGLEDMFKECVFYACISGEGWMSMTWDPYAGEPYAVDPMTGTTVKTGDVTARAYAAYEVARDICRTDMENEWLIPRRFVNRWNLMAQYPEKADEIKSYTARPVLNDPYNTFTYRNKYDRNFDYVELREFFHAKTAAMPEGRFVRSVGKTVLYDGPLPYDELPLYLLAENVEPLAPFGNTSTWDLIGPQQAIDSAVSTILTNHEAFGIQNVLIPKGCDLNVNDLGGGLRAVEYNAAAGEPKVLQLSPAGDASYKMAEYLTGVVETLSGINAVSRGNPQASLKSGAALALVQSMSIQANTGLAQALIRLEELVGTAMIRCYQAFAEAPMLIEMVGIDQKASIISFTGKRLTNIRRITVTVGGPLMRTQAGRIQIADSIAEKWPDAVTPAQYFEMMETGRLEPIYKAPIMEPMWIHHENDNMLQGKPVKAIATENHKMHIDEHMLLTFDEVVRTNGVLLKAILDHISEHQQFEAPPVGTAPALPAETAANVQSNAFQPGGFKAPPKKEPRAMVPGAYQNTEGTSAQPPIMPMNPMSGQRTSPTGSNGGPQ